MKKIIKWLENNRNEILIVLFFGTIALGALISLISIMAIIMYWGKPITDIPAWALLLMFGRKGGHK